ncbi:MAG: glycosyltransferase involved in cell wall biosynthesis [Candidatus Omnitrophota bacterium]|jgi:glycosyltransferase involved in cell wall biosynthesis
MAGPSRFCVVMPAFNEAERIAPVIEAVREHGVDVIVVDDGSADETATVSKAAGAQVVIQETNQGKGAALQRGFQFALDNFYEALITMDADGQHDPADIAKFIDAYDRTGIPVLIGNRMADPTGMPFVRRCTNRLMSWLLGRHMRQFIPDSQNGFRLYQVDVLPMVSTEARGYAAESEILLKLDRIGIRMDSIPVKTVYGSEESKIRPVKDSLRFLKMFFRYVK